MCGKVTRILIVDDDKDILVNLSDILSDVGYETDTAPCGEDAIGKVRRDCSENDRSEYDLCLLDFKMPGMDGVELYRQIREHDPELRAIMMTAYAGEEGVNRAEKAGTWRVLRKPVDIKVLLAMIREAVV